MADVERPAAAPQWEEEYYIPSGSAWRARCRHEGCGYWVMVPDRAEADRLARAHAGLRKHDTAVEREVWP